MADSVRKQVIDSITNAISASTGVTTTSNDLKSWFEYDAHEFPVVTVLDRDTDIVRFAFESTGTDKQADINVLVRGYVFDQNNTTYTKRTNLIKDIQTTLKAGTTSMNTLIFDIEDMSIETDDGIQDNYSVFDINYSVKYNYNHASP